MKLISAIYTVRNFLWRWKLKFIIGALKLLAYRFSLSKKGFLTLACIFVFSGVVAGYAWRILQVEPQHRQDVFYLLTYINDTHREIKALKSRLADAEGKIGQKIVQANRQPPPQTAKSRGK